MLNNGPRRGEQATYNILNFPKSLQKKVTLLKHFRDYLVEQQKHDDDEETGTYLDSLNAILAGNGNACDLVYVKKWIRTKHAILFRLSDQTVQIVFYDQTEVLLTPDERFVTFVDKTRVRCTYYLSDELVGCNDGLAKRLKYCREILQQLLLCPR
jgi:polo-like kinase 1